MKLIQDGPRQAKIVIVGEAPGDNEMRTGTPFTGGSGELLNKMLSNAGIHRHQCFMTNVCHIQPQGSKKNDFAWFFKPEGLPYLQQGLLRLYADLQEIRPNLVIALGAMPLRALTGKVGIDKWRGSILESSILPGQKVIATYHPAFLLRSWDHKAVAELDLARCAGDSGFPDLRLPVRQLHLNPQGKARRELMAAFLDTDWLGTDIECWEGADGKWHLACCGFSDRPDRALVIHNYTKEDKNDIEFMTKSPVEKVMQNGQFDYTVLTELSDVEVNGFGEHIYEDGKLVRVRGWDTMLAHHALYPECAGGGDEYSALQKGGTTAKKSAAIKKGLAFLVSVNTREPFYKDDGKLWRETSDLQMFWRYNGLDAATTREIRDVQQTDLRTFGTEGVFQHEMSLLRPLMACTTRGIPVDLRERQRLRSELEVEISNLQLFLDTGAGRSINVSSYGANGDVGKLVYGQLGLPVQLNKETRNPSVDKDAIIALAQKHKHPLLLSILAIRERRTILQSFLSDNVDSDGRMRCSYDPTGTRTGRLASRASIFGSGQNLQNQPDKIRRTFVAPPGYVFIQPDYSQAEARVVAYLAREPGLIELFSDPTKDVHRFNASRIYGTDEWNVTYEMRFTAKRGTHSANYGVGPEKTMMVINQDAKDTWGKPGTGITVSLEQSRRIVEGYFALYPRIKTIFWTDVVNQLKRNRTLTGVFGRKRTFFGRWDGGDDGKFLNAAYSYIPQNAIGDLCTMAMVEIEDKVNTVTMLGNVHDSILVLCLDDPEVIEQSISAMRSAMAIPLTVHGETFYIPTEFAVGYNWGKKGKDGSNPLGLEDADKWLAARRGNLAYRDSLTATLTSTKSAS